MLDKTAQAIPLCSIRRVSVSVPCLSRCSSGSPVCASHTHSVSLQPASVRYYQTVTVCNSPPVFPCRALRVRKKMSGEKMPVKMIGDILSAQLPHMQPYIRFCSCQLNGAALIQQKTDEAPDFKEFVKVRRPGLQGGRGDCLQSVVLRCEGSSKVHKHLSTNGLQKWMEVFSGTELAGVGLTRQESHPGSESFEMSFRDMLSTCLRYF